MSPGKHIGLQIAWEEAAGPKAMWDELHPKQIKKQVKGADEY